MTIFFMQLFKSDISNSEYRGQFPNQDFTRNCGIYKFINAAIIANVPLNMKFDRI